MGCGRSSRKGQETDPDPDSRPSSAELQKSNGIDQVLAMARHERECKLKLLLLGPLGSGKSTISKQFRILHGAPWTDEELDKFGVVVRSNIISAVRKLCRLLQRHGMEEPLAREEAPLYSEDDSMTPKKAFDDLVVACLVAEETHVPLKKEVLSNGHGPDQDQDQDRVGKGVELGYNHRDELECCNYTVVELGLGHKEDEVSLFLQLWHTIKVLFESETVQEVMQTTEAKDTLRGHEAFLQDLGRIASPTYRPTMNDILLARSETTRLGTERLRIEGLDCELHDIGGQWSEQRKGMDCFNDVDAVIFVAALSDFDQTTTSTIDGGETETNRMAEALEMFKSTCHCRAFKNTTLVLYLTKKDVFSEKIMDSDIQRQEPFQDYDGPRREYHLGASYFIEKFESYFGDYYGNPEKLVLRIVCATDTVNVEFHLGTTNMINEITQAILRRSGFLDAARVKQTC